MRNPQNPGGQANENLVRRTKVNWCLPSLAKCEAIISAVVTVYREGDENIRSHRRNTFFSEGARKYKTSKGIDKDEEKGRCSFCSV